MESPVKTNGPVVQDQSTPKSDEQVAATSGLGNFASPSDTYDNYDRVSNASSPTTAGSTVNTYHYNANGELATDTPAGQSAVSYSYGPTTDELTSVTNPNAPAPTADTSLAYTANGQRCWSSSSSAVVGSPSCGSAPPSGSTANVYGWNAFGQLTCSATVTAATSSCSTATGESTYSYDGNGLRTSVTSGSSTKTFTWDLVDGGTVPLDIDDGTNAYIYGPLLFGATAPVEQIPLTPTPQAEFLASTPSGVQTVFGPSKPTSPASPNDKYTYQQISAVGSLASASGTGLATLAVSPVNVGDALVLSVKVASSSVTVSSVTGGGATWTKLHNATGSTQARDTELWLGTVATTGSSTITVTYSGSVASIATELSSQEFTNGTGPTTTWAKDVSGSSDNTTSSTTIKYPSLTPTGSAELYVGFARAAGTASAGSTAGFTYDLTPTNGDVYLYNPNVSAASAPTATQSPSGVSLAVGAMIKATVPSAGPTVTKVTPVAGGPNGGTSVTITGTNLTGATAVSFGGTAATSYSVANSSTIVASAPAKSTGMVDVTVTGVNSDTLYEQATYSPYGGQVIQAGADVSPFGYQGSYIDASGLVYLITRYYDPSTSQFMSIDPMYSQSDRAYDFAGDDPLNASDPLGLMFQGPQHQTCESQLGCQEETTTRQNTANSEVSQQSQVLLHNTSSASYLEANEEVRNYLRSLAAQAEATAEKRYLQGLSDQWLLEETEVAQDLDVPGPSIPTLAPERSGTSSSCNHAFVEAMATVVVALIGMGLTGGWGALLWAVESSAEGAVVGAGTAATAGGGLASVASTVAVLASCAGD